MKNVETIWNLWNGAEDSKQGGINKKIYILTIHTMKYLKHYYGSITFCENIPSVCVCVCVWLTQLKL